jgi:two-component system chemotaxis response regulator CheB
LAHPTDVIARNIIAIGASAGGIEAIQKVISGFQPDLRAAVFVTQHLSDRSQGILPDILNRVGSLPAMHPWEETPIQMGRIYVAPPDYHLLLTPDTVYLGHGPKENLQRPCINTMFRSAAASHGERVAGVLLTGLLDDGAAGLWEIQQKGGATIVQDPGEAEYKSMPESAIRGLNVQYIVRLAEMAPLLTRLTMGDKNVQLPGGAKEQIELSVSQTCPECGGAMKAFRVGQMIEYKCHVGHRLGLKSMISDKGRVVEKAVWTALSQSEELVELLELASPHVDRETAESLIEEINQRREDHTMLRRIVERTKTPL